MLRGQQRRGGSRGWQQLQVWMNGRDLTVIGGEVAGIAEQLRRVERKVDRWSRGEIEGAAS